MANLSTHLHHGHAMPRLKGGILMLGERGVMVAMGHGLCVCFCVCGRLAIVKLANNMVQSISNTLLVCDKGE